MASDPPLWGPLFWNFLHASGQAYEIKFGDSALPDDYQSNLKKAMVLLCGYLPCGACTIHCTQYTLEHPPTFSTGRDWWTYGVDFHNSVNKRTRKLEYTYEESRAYVEEQMKSENKSLEQISTILKDEWWTAIMMTGLRMSMTPDKPTDEEKTRYRELLLGLTYMMPFGFKVLSDGRVCREVMQEFLNSEKLNLSNREELFTSLLNLYNLICQDFGKIIKTNKEMNEGFAKRFEHKTSIETLRAHEIRKQDHTKMLALQAEIENLQKLLNSDNGSGSGPGSSNGYRTATIVLSCILALCLISLFIMIKVYGYRLKRSKQDSGSEKAVKSLDHKSLDHKSLTRPIDTK